jgi:hypothetical protein
MRDLLQRLIVCSLVNLGESVRPSTYNVILVVILVVPTCYIFSD